MKKTKKLLATTVLSTFLLTGLPSVAMAQNVTVTLPDFPVTLNGIELQPSIEDYPVIVYNNITYFPMTYHYANFLGLSTEWADNTLTVQKIDTNTKKLRTYEKKRATKINIPRLFPRQTLWSMAKLSITAKKTILSWSFGMSPIFL